MGDVGENFGDWGDRGESGRERSRDSHLDQKLSEVSDANAKVLTARYINTITTVTATSTF